MSANVQGFHFANNTVQDISTAQGRLHGLILGNNNAAITFYQFFLLAHGGVTLGTTPAQFVIPVPANQTLVVAVAEFWNDQFSALSFVPTTTYNGSTAPGAACDAVAITEPA